MGEHYPELTLQSLRSLLNARFSDEFLTLMDLPHPSTFKDMDRATARIAQAIKNSEKITVIGDYDVDGIISTTLMKLFFDEIGYPVEWIIPNRFQDGYGLSANMIPRIKSTDLAITVDNGISAVEAAQMCKELGIDLIITDHHLLPPELPEAYAIIDQKQKECNFPYKEVCGAQIAWYLIASLKNHLNIEIDLMAYMELVAIAIIADVMPLQHINRVMVTAGLKRLAKSRRPAIRTFLEQREKRILSSEDIAFFLAPLLNSAGRMDDASHAVDFLTSENIYEARVKLGILHQFNTLRKETEEAITGEALEMVNENDKFIVLWGEAWHEGVLGIVASRIARIHQKPAIILSYDKNGLLKGSGRSFAGCDIFEITDRCREYLEKFGGHQAAIGLSLQKKNLEIFIKSIQDVYDTNSYTENRLDPEIVGQLGFNEINKELIELINQYEPFGEANTRPKFITCNVSIKDVNTMGKEHNHLKFIFEKEGVLFTGIKFKSTESFEIGKEVSVTYTLHENSFRGKNTLQLLVDNII